MSWAATSREGNFVGDVIVDDMLLRLFVAPQRWERLALGACVVFLLAAVAVTVYATGGTKYPYPHLAYLPIIVAALFFGVPGGMLAGMAAGLALGPYMPLMVADGTPQATADWIFRTAMFVAAGTGTGAMAAVLQRSAHNALSQMYFDAATHLPNREHMVRALHQNLAAGGPVGVLVVDIGAFRSVAESFGLGVGDGLVAAAAERVRGALAPGTKVFRKNAGQLGIVIAAAPDAADVAALVQRLTDPVNVADLPLPLDAVIGVVSEADGAGEPESLLQRAAIAAADAHENGLEWKLYDSAAIDNEKERLRLLADARMAIDNDQFFLLYQPKVRLRDGAVVGCEALVRWRHPQNGVVPPGRFIPVLERSNVICQLTDRVLDQALAQVQAWLAQGSEIPVSINVSARDLSDPAIVERILDRVDRAGVPRGLVDIEITESVAIRHGADVLNHLCKLRRAGLSLSIDDYGTGMSSLSYLKQIPATQLKIDQYFVRTIADVPTDRVLVESTVDLCRRMGLDVVAEGIENEQVATILADMGCTFGQGYFYGRPQPAEDLLASYRRAVQSG